MIYETIITSVDAENRVHVAPFGIREHEDQVIISPFRPSGTLDNLLANRCAVVNMVDDVRIFAGALTGHNQWPSYSAAKVKGVVLEAALAHRELELTDIKEDASRPQLYFNVVHEEVHNPFRGFNRARHPGEPFAYATYGKVRCRNGLFADCHRQDRGRA